MSNIDRIFSLCVKSLLITADMVGTSYNAVNVWLFCVIGPLIFILMTGYIWHLRVKISYYKASLTIYKSYNQKDQNTKITQ
jgi:hypothetical protein